MTEPESHSSEMDETALLRAHLVAARAESAALRAEYKERLAAAHRERDAARATLERWTEYLEGLLTRLRANRAVFDMTRASLLDAAGELSGELTDRPDSVAMEWAGLAEELARRHTAFLALDAENRQACSERDHLEQLLEETRGEQGRLNVALDAARGRVAALDADLERVRKESAARGAELDALRRAMAIEDANMAKHTETMEERLSRLNSACAVVRQTSTVTETKLDHIAGELQEAAVMLRTIGDRHAVLKTIAAEPSEETPQDDRQPSLFDGAPGAEVPISTEDASASPVEETPLEPVPEEAPEPDPAGEPSEDFDAGK
jgi:chromosome segregation ATPase